MSRIATAIASLRSPIFILTAVGAGVASASGQTTVTVIPLVDSVTNELTFGHTQIVFGYFNVTSTVQTVSYGSRNFTTPGQQIRFSQPASFLPGIHHNVWEANIPFDFGPLSWSLSGLLATGVPAEAVNYVRNAQRFGGDPFLNTYTHTSESAQLVSPTLVIEQEGVLIMSSGTLAATTIENRGTGTVRLVGGTLTGSTSFTNSALLQLEGGALSTPSFTNSTGGHIKAVSGSTTLPAFTSSGLLEISGGTLEISDGLDLAPTGTLRLNGGTLVSPDLANGGGTLDLRAGTLRLTTGNLGTGAGSALGANPSLNGPVTVELAAGSTTVALGTTLTLANGATLKTQGGANHGTVTVVASTLSSQSGLFTNHSGRTLYAVDSTLTFSGDGLRNDGVLNLVNTTVNGDVYSPAGSTINVSNTVTFNGDFHGAANFTGSDTAVFNGTYSPGDSPALVDHEGNLTFTSGNTLVMELAGLARGTGYDALDVGGALTFGGDLRIDLLDEFSPVDGSSFDLFDFNPTLSSGSFANFQLPELDAGLTWDTSQLYSTGVLSVSAIPEPAAFATLLAAGALTAAVSSRRRRAS